MAKQNAQRTINGAVDRKVNNRKLNSQLRKIRDVRDSFDNDYEDLEVEERYLRHTPRKFSHDDF